MSEKLKIIPLENLKDAEWQISNIYDKIAKLEQKLKNIEKYNVNGHSNYNERIEAIKKKFTNYHLDLFPEWQNELSELRILATAKAIVVPEGKAIMWDNKLKLNIKAIMELKEIQIQNGIDWLETIEQQSREITELKDQFIEKNRGINSNTVHDNIKLRERINVDIKKHDKDIVDLRESLRALGGFSNEHAYDIAKMIGLYDVHEEQITLGYNQRTILKEVLRELVVERVMEDAVKWTSTLEKLEGEKTVGDYDLLHQNHQQQVGGVPLKTDSKPSEPIPDELMERIMSKKIEPMKRPSEKLNEYVAGMREKERAYEESLEPETRKEKLLRQYRKQEKEENEKYLESLEPHREYHILGDEEEEVWILVMKTDLINLFGALEGQSITFDRITEVLEPFQKKYLSDSVQKEDK